jgi:DNA helicase-2/ATP-dependent DNA helicase PcrA
MGRDSSPSPMSFVKNLVPRRPAEPRPASTAAAHTPSSDFVPSDTRGLVEGDKVEHSKFGFGKVVKMDVNGTDRKATVKFDTVGDKTLLLSFAKLRIVK